MSPAPVRTTGAAVPTATSGAVAIAAVATVVIEAVARVVAGSEDTRQPGNLKPYRQLHNPLLIQPSQIGAAQAI